MGLEEYKGHANNPKFGGSGGGLPDIGVKSGEDNPPSMGGPSLGIISQILEEVLK